MIQGFIVDRVFTSVRSVASTVSRLSSSLIKGQLLKAQIVVIVISSRLITRNDLVNTRKTII